MAIIFGLTVLGGCGLLALAIWPGVLEDAVFQFPFFCLSMPLLGAWFLLLVGLAVPDLLQQSDPLRRRRRWGMWSAAVMFGTMALLRFHVPQRLAFAPFCFELRGLVDAAPVESYRGEELGRRIGPYWVDRYGTDRRGGVYFRTHTGPDGIGPDQMSYGFAFRPNEKGTPFGNAHYRRLLLFGDWYVFAASDDW
jgi:hypothetical protein